MRITSRRMRHLLKVYFIMGTLNCIDTPHTVLRQAIAGGITLFQYREKGKGALKGESKYQLATELQAICHEHLIPFIVNDDIDLAISLNADGVHIGQDDEPAGSVRQKLGNDKIVGVSAHNMKEVNKAIKDGADYIGIGPAYPTTTKTDTRNIDGIALIRSLRTQGLAIPIVGIGGINPTNCNEVISAGADGISVITAISHARSPYDVTCLLNQAVESSLVNSLNG